MVQLHKRFTDSQVREIIERYLRKEIERRYIQEVLNIGKTRFFALIRAYHQDPHEFSIHYARHTTTRRIPQAVDENILREFHIEKPLRDKKKICQRQCLFLGVQSGLDKSGDVG